MTGRDRVLTSLAHREPDRVPFDLGSTQASGIAIRAYQRLREYLGLPASEPQTCDIIQQLCVPDDDVLDSLRVDTRGLFPLCSHNLPLPVGGEEWRRTHREAGDSWEYDDEWGCTHRLPKQDGLYYSLCASPLPAAEVSVCDVEPLSLPTGDEPWRVRGLKEAAADFRAEGRAVVLKSLCAGLVEMGERVRGMENFLVDLLVSPDAAQRVLDRFLEIKVRFWERALAEVGELVDVVMEADDYGTQETQLVSPHLFRELVKPRLRELLTRIKELAPHVKVFFHSCGSVRPLIPDFIELGVDILNPVHISAEGMEPRALKRDFGDALCFWGGGVETQQVLPRGSPEDVKEDVRRNVEALAPCGGWVFNTVHNIQADVPPENVMAMWDALREYGVY